MLCLLLLPLAWLAADAGSWRHVRIGPPMVELRDFAVGAYYRGSKEMPAREDVRPAGMTAVDLYVVVGVAIMELQHRSRNTETIASETTLDANTWIS